MAHIRTSHLGLWKPQDLNLDKISSQKMFIDNINALELFAQSILQNVHQSVQSLDELRAIDTSDRTIFKTGMLIMLNGYGIYSFNRDSTADESHAVVVPTTGGGRWIATTASDIVLTPIEVQSNDALDSRLELILTNMSPHSIKFFVIRAMTEFVPFKGGTIHMTMYKVSNLYASISCIVYNADRIAKIYTRARYDGIWGRWVMAPFLDSNGKIPVDQLPTSTVATAKVE